MRRSTLVTPLVVLIILAGSLQAMASTSRLIPQDEAARHGLRRAWFAQVRLDPGRSRVSYLRLFEGTEELPDTLFVQTDQGVVHALDAETGQTLWVRAVGNREFPTMALGANKQLVCVFNGTKLYLLDRSNGFILREQPIEGVPADGPVLTDKFTFVPTLSGLIYAHKIEKRVFENEDEPLPLPAPAAKKNSEENVLGPSEETPVAVPQAKQEEGPLALKQTSSFPLTCVSFGPVACQPIFLLESMKNQYVAWSTTRGLFVGYVDLQRQREFAVRYQLRTDSEIITQPTYLPPAVGNGNTEGLIFTASKLGHIYAISATRGVEKWKYAVGQPIAEPIMPIDGRIYVTTRLGHFFCLKATTGSEHWSTRGVGQFIAASKDRVYVADRFGQIRVLDAESGATIDGLFAAASPIKFRNTRTDRIYLAGPTGLIQCLHEIGQSKPIYHLEKAKLEIDEAGDEFVPAAKPDKPADDDENPDEDEDPFG